VAPNLEAAVTRALEKVPADRFASATDLAVALDDPAFRHGTLTNGEPAGAGRARSAGLWHRPMMAMTVVAALTTGLAAWTSFRPEAGPEAGVPIRAELPVIGENSLGGNPFAISRDGRWIVASRPVEGVGGGRALSIRSIGGTEWRVIPNTEGGSDPSFSPNGDWLVFRNRRQLLRVPIAGGPAIPVVARAGRPHWTETDEILFESEGALYQVRASGGEPRLLFQSDSIYARLPHLLPNGRAVVFSTGAGGDPLTARILLFEIETGEVRELVSSGTSPSYLPTGHLLYGHGDGALMGLEFDLRTLQTRGEPVTLLPDLRVMGGGASQFAVSATGTLIYKARGAVTSDALSWVDMQGNETTIPIGMEEANTPRVSPDGDRVAYRSGDHIYIWNEVEGTNRQLTFEGTNVSPAWSVDGRWVYFLSERTDTDGSDGFRRAADGSSQAERLWTAEGEAAITSISPDGRWLVVGEDRPDTGLDIGLAALGTDSVSVGAYLRSDLDESEGVVSPDGRWMAYLSRVADRADGVFVRGFPEPTGLWRVSDVSEAGHDPVWAPDGRAIYYLTGSPGNGYLHRVEVSTEGSFSPGRSERLFFSAGGHENRFDRGYDIHPDGDRVVVANSGTSTGTAFIVANWFAELEELMGEGN
jgi:serine/threonine-protein kinase